jgi:hypothetical protein
MIRDVVLRIKSVVRKAYTDFYQYLPGAHIHLLNVRLPVLLPEIVDKRLQIND